MAEAEREQMARKHILVVNGSADFLDILRDLLQEEQYNVTTTNFVPRTFEQIEALRPQLLIVDLVIGERAGWDLLERLREEALTRGIPVIVTSTNERLLEQAKGDAARDGDKLFMAKPMNLNELLDAIQSLIGGAESNPAVTDASPDSVRESTPPP